MVFTLALKSLMSHIYNKILLRAEKQERGQAGEGTYPSGTELIPSPSAGKGTDLNLSPRYQRHLYEQRV